MRSLIFLFLILAAICGSGRAANVEVSTCAVGCMKNVTVTHSLGEFCLSSMAQVNTTKLAFQMCMFVSQCPELANPSQLPSLIFDFCESVITSDATLLARLLKFNSTAVPLTRDDRMVTGWFVQMVIVVIFLPLFVWNRDQRIIRFRHWSMCATTAVWLLIYIGLVAFFYTGVSDLKSVSETKIRMWIGAILVSFSLAMPGFYALILTHYFLDKAQRLRAILRAELPQVYHYDRLSQTSTPKNSIPEEPKISTAAPPLSKKQHSQIYQPQHDQLHITATSLRRVNFWAQERMCFVYYFLTAIPMLCFLAWLMSVKWGQPDFEEYTVWVFLWQILGADLLILVLRVPWVMMGDNMAIKWQILVTAIVMTFNKGWTAYDYYHHSQATADGLVWLAVFVPIFYQILLLAAPTVVALLPGYQDTVRKTRTGLLWLTRSSHGASSIVSETKGSMQDLHGTNTTTSVRHGSKSAAVSRVGQEDTPTQLPVMSDTIRKITTSISSTAVNQRTSFSHPMPVNAASTVTSHQAAQGGAQKRNRSTCHPPTRELDLTLAHPTTLSALTTFAAHEFCTENLLFLANTMDYRHRYSRFTGPDRLTYAQNILYDFVRAGSTNEVNLPSGIRREIEKKLKEAPTKGDEWNGEKVFDDAVEHVKQMLATDILPRYKRSRFYIEPGSGA
ncbi:hypothetical protein SpCBS45565_g08444 [Spizellomyces sp. 'palustris']|nr:hypothetical protein SpCBS45565_g08444 [Spizellomyces sp. 'palustris']